VSPYDPAAGALPTVTSEPVEIPMKVRPSVKKICDKCKVVRRKGVVRIICDNRVTAATRLTVRKN